MNAPVMFNRRLRAEEFDEWVKLIENFTDTGCIERNLAYSYLQLPETIAFVSSINDEIIGGTAIYRDRIRLGMVLSSVAISREHRETSAYHIIKTSLPFMRTAAIRDVDAIVVDDSSKEGVGFPASLALDSWTGKILGKIGFVPAGKIWNYTLELKEFATLISNEKKWDREPNIEGSKQLVWSQSKVGGLATSTIWNTLDFAMNRGVLKTYTVGDSTRMAASIGNTGSAIVLGLLVIDPEYSSKDAVNQIATEICRQQKLKIHLPLIGENQRFIVELLSEQLGGSLKEQSMTLMRKYL